MRILVVGDIHGRIEQLRKVVEITGAKAVLQVGDLGFYPDVESMDGPGRRKIVKEPSQGEIFAYISKEKTFPCPLYFVRGNHEAFPLLQKFEELEIPNFFYLRTGLHSVESVQVAAVGGIYYGGQKAQRQSLPKYTKEAEVEFVFTSTAADVMLAHDCPEGKGYRSGGAHGSPFVTLALEALKPQLLFHGHYASNIEPYAIGPTQVYPMTLRREWSEEKGIYVVGEAAFGILETHSSELSFDYLLKEEVSG
jgi:Icc-related predicted phosphoesterase